jgi:hypothetical protein
MYWHPLLMAIISAQTVALFLLLTAGLTSFRTTLHWQPASADSRQLSLEAALETASILGRAAFWLFLFAAFLLVFGIANVFHEDIPGAMCGTGVCQAMGGGSTKLLLFSGLLLVVMQLWYEMDKLNRMQVDIPLTEFNARLFLVILPVAALTLLQTYHTFAGIRPQRPVDCCAVVYDQFQTLLQARSIVGLADAWWIAAFIFLSILLLGLSVFMSAATVKNPKLRLALTVLCLLWLPVAALTLVNNLSAYHYQVLHHHCPWCLFLPEHSLVGYPLYGALWFIGLEGVTIFILPRMVSENSQVYGHVLDRCLRAARRITIAEIIFLILALAPAIIWRMRFGVWMSG